MQAVILAGGRGVRLKPYTMILPKPLMPVFDRAIIEIIIRQIENAGVRDIAVSTGYLSQLVETYLGDGSRFRAGLRYVHEKEPLGTAGPIGLVEGLSEDFIIINGDTVSDIDFRAMHEEHRESGNDVTIGTFLMTYRIDLGVLELDDEKRLVGYSEKPEMKYAVSMGIYICSPRIVEEVERGERLDLPDLVLRLKDKGYRVASYIHPGFWLDMGRPSDFMKINEDEELRERILALGAE